MATHSSILAWRVPWTEEPGGLQSMGSQRVGHNRARAHVHMSHKGTGEDWPGEPLTDCPLVSVAFASPRARLPHVIILGIFILTASWQELPAAALINGECQLQFSQCQQ